MTAKLKRFERIGQRVLVFKWEDLYAAPDRIISTRKESADGQPATVTGISADGTIAHVEFDGPLHCIGRTRREQCAIRFRDPKTPSAQRLAAKKARGIAKATAERKTERTQILWTRAELRTILALGKLYTEEDRRAGVHNPGVTTAEIIRRATLAYARERTERTHQSPPTVRAG